MTSRRKRIAELVSRPGGIGGLTVGKATHSASQRAPLPRDVALSGSTTDLREQFVLSRSLDPPEGFVSEDLAGWTLARHPTLPVVAVHGDACCSDGVPMQRGWLLGYPITADGVLLAAGSSIKIPLGMDPTSVVDSMGGRFVAVLVHGPTPAIYPDAVGSYSSVFCPSLGIAASTPGLVPYDETTGDRVALVEQLGIPFTNSMFPLGLTPRFGVHRLLPNHHLDLTSWTMVRHGPTWHERGSFGVEESVSRIAAIVRRNIHAVMDAHPSYLQLTSGHDSRMLLACARDRRADLATYTLKFPDVSGANDAKVAAQISRRVGVSHRTVRMRRPNPAGLEMWVYRTACSAGEPRGWRADAAYRSLDSSRVHLAGNVGDLARIGYWATITDADTPPTLEQLASHALAHLRPELDPGQQLAAASDTVRDEIERWRESAAAPDALALLDLLFVENRLACWAGVWPYAQHAGLGFTVFPMGHREVIDLMVSLPESVRRSERLNRMVIEQEWPQLLDFPFNTPSRSVRVASLPTRAAQDARRRVQALRGRYL